MIVSDDKACRLPASIAHEGEPPVVVGRMVQVPYQIVPLYAALLIALGWFAGEQWRNPPVTSALVVPAAHAALVPMASSAQKKVKPVAAPEPEKAKPEAIVDDDNLPALRYSAHVYASSAEKRSIVLNGQSWKEGESPLPNLVIEQIQQDVTLFSFNGKTFTLAALDDWPGGIIEDSPQGE
ncbi:type II secretion system assembly factor GspB [Raoultella ornithinolytica]|uniref:type II secretion system assembly factor GspB n=1 Tax=Raoultella ornithinolytica TaxID=54291 RepID=UPI0021AEF4D6|nr:type II secretion system assembly factor GspB [Raoultella ornithinolytica]